jgi:hypothetical protein
MIYAIPNYWEYYKKADPQQTCFLILPLEYRGIIE